VCSVSLPLSRSSCSSPSICLLLTSHMQDRSLALSYTVSLAVSATPHLSVSLLFMSFPFDTFLLFSNVLCVLSRFTVEIEKNKNNKN
jgi:hypothetical protein